MGAVALASIVVFTIGLFVVAVGVAITAQNASGGPTVIEVALGAAPAAPIAVEGDPQESVVFRALQPVLETGSAIVRRLSPASFLDRYRNQIVYAGQEGVVTVERILGLQAVGFVVGCVLAFVVRNDVPYQIIVLPVIIFGSFYAPAALLDGRAQNRQNLIGKALPEALDLMALTVEAGLGLEQAVQVVTENSTGPLSGELSRFLRESELGVPRREALRALRDRTNVPDLSTFVVSLVQADQMGAAVADVLKSQSQQVRLRRQQRAREKAGQTPVKILIPLIIGIFPAIFVVTIGPGAISILNAFKK